MLVLPVITTETRTDTDSLYKWDTIVITRADGIETGRVVTYDDTTVRTEERTDGVLTNLLLEDPSDINAWTSIETTYDALTGLITSKTTVNDDGQTTAETYTDGIKTQVVRTDTANVSSYASVTDTYDAVTGLRTSSVTVSDLGVTTTDDFDAEGNITTRTQVDLTGLDSTAGWSEVVTSYDTSGVVTEKLWTFDTGVTRAETFTGGVVSQVVQTDSDQATWATITETFDAAVLTERVKVEDNGNITTETYVGGNLSQLSITEVANAPGINWATLTRTFDGSGNLTGETQVMDDGKTIAKTITQSGGVDVVTQVVRTDGAGTASTANWASMTDVFATDGSIESHSVTFDDGVVNSKTYVSGIVATQTVTDASDAHNYDSIEKVYTDGVLSQNTTVFDNGVSSVIDFDATGVRTHVTTTDATGIGSTASWSTVDKTYVDGQMTDHNMVLDDGRQVDKTYAAGVLQSVVMSDDSDVKGWTSIDKQYDAGGALDLATVVLDNGRTVVTDYDAGVKLSTTVSDTGVDVPTDSITGAFNWDTIDIVYHADGKTVASRDVVYDSGDEVLFLFDDTGLVTDRVQFDGDSSNNWEYRVTTFDAVGTATVTLHDATDLSNDYRDYFDLAPL